MTWREGSLAEHGETGGAVSGGAVVSDPSHVLGFVSGVDPPGLEEEHHVRDLFDHGAVGKLQVVLRVSVTTAWRDTQKVIWRPCCIHQPVTIKLLTDKVVRGDCGDCADVNAFDELNPLDMASDRSKMTSRGKIKRAMCVVCLDVSVFDKPEDDVHF